MISPAIQYRKERRSARGAGAALQKQVKIRPLGKLDGFTVWLVDGAQVRRQVLVVLVEGGTRGRMLVTRDEGVQPTCGVKVGSRKSHKYGGVSIQRTAIHISVIVSFATNSMQKQPKGRRRE